MSHYIAYKKCCVYHFNYAPHVQYVICTLRRKGSI